MLNREELPQEANEKLTKILRKEIVELSLQDRVFLQARREYLTDAEAETFEEVLTEKAIKADGPKLQKQQKEAEAKLGVGEFRGASVPQETAPVEETPEDTKKEEKAPKEEKSKK